MNPWLQEGLLGGEGEGIFPVHGRLFSAEILSQRGGDEYFPGGAGGGILSTCYNNFFWQKNLG